MKAVGWLLLALLLAQVLALAGCASSSDRQDEPDRLPDVTLQPLSSGDPVELLLAAGAAGGEPLGELVRALQA